MLGDDDLVAIGVASLLWIAALVTFLARRGRAARWLTAVAAAATLLTLFLLHTGAGRRA